MKEVPAVEVSLHDAQTLLSILRDGDLIDTSLELSRTDKTLTVPLKRLPPDQITSRIRELTATLIAKSGFVESLKKPKNLIEAVRSELPNDLLEYLPKSYDIIGDVALVDLADAIQQFGETVGKAIQEINPHVRLVVRKLGGVSGTYRIRSLEVLTGTGSTETEHCEYSCRYGLDVSAVYFNPRLSHERMRVAKQVAYKETVVDMFAGVGPFSILIAKMNPNARVYACDINPAAVKYLKNNVILNTVSDRVIPILGDAQKLSQEAVGRVDRVVMNLPSNSETYLPAALNFLAEGGMVHYYTFAARNENLDNFKSSFQNAVQRAGRNVRSFCFTKAIREIAPGTVQIAMDVLIQ